MAHCGCVYTCRRDKAAGGGLFEGDGIQKPQLKAPSSVYAGGAKSGRLHDSDKKSKTERNKLKRHGKGANAFKSKAKHKRKR